MEVHAGKSENSGNSGNSGASGYKGRRGNAEISGNLGDSQAFASILARIFVVLRGCIARATRLAARRAEPMFLLTGAALSRVRRLCRKTNNRRKSTKNRSDNASRTHSAEKTRFFRSRTRLGVDFCLLGMLPGAPGRPFWRPGAPLATLRTLPRRAGDAPGRSRDAPETSSRRSWEPWGVPTRS